MFDFTSTQDYIEIGSDRIDIQNVKLVKKCYDELTGQVIGTAMAKMLTFDMPDTSVTVEGQTFVYHAVTVGADGNGEDTVVGTFIAYTAPVKITEGVTRVVAYDLMFKGNVEYSSTLDYGSAVTMRDVLNDACTQAGIMLADNTSLVNGSFVVSENPFLIGQTCCEVFAAVAETNGVIALIIDDVLTFKTLDITADPVAEVIAPQYSTLTIQNQYPVITKVTMRDTLIGESASVGVDGGEIVFKDNPFGATSANRMALLGNILTVVSGFTYYVYAAKGLGDPRLECGDRVRVIDAEQNEYDTFVFSMSYISTGADISQNSTISANAMAQAAVANIKPRTTSTERIAKRSYNAAVTAQSSANGKNTVYYLPTEPTGGVYIDGDIWFDTANGNKVNVYQTGAWTAVQYGTDALAVGAITAASGIVGSLDAGVITAGTLNAGIIFAGILAAASGTFENLIAGLENAQRMEQGYDANNDPYIRMYDNSDTLRLSLVKTGVLFGNTSKFKEYTAGDRTGVGIFIG